MRRPDADIHGVLVVDKPAGFTSFDVIAKLRGILGTRKLGHSGTLDPMATGVLPVFAGRATRAVDLQRDSGKAYEAEILFGLSTDSGDITGAVTRRQSCAVTAAMVEKALPAFLGPRLQTPPMVSAVKVGGVPLYKLARAGQEAERAPRPIEIYKIEYLGGSGENRHRLWADCSKGTYMRVLAEELGEALGCPATLRALRRTRAGRYTLADAVPLDEIQRAADEGRVQALLRGVETVFADWPRLDISAAAAEDLRHGRATAAHGDPGDYALYCAGAFLGAGRLGEGRLRVIRLFEETR